MITIFSSSESLESSINLAISFTDEDIEIELREEEPAFLQGQTKLSIDVSPIKIVKVSKGEIRHPGVRRTFENIVCEFDLTTRGGKNSGPQHQWSQKFF